MGALGFVTDPVLAWVPAQQLPGLLGLPALHL